MSAHDDHPPPPGGATGPAGSSGVAITGTADLGIRIGARLLDVVIVGIPASIIIALLGLATAGPSFGYSYLPGVVYSLLWFGYFAVMESTSGATVGKRLVHTKVVTADGQVPSFEVAAKRNVWMLFGLIPLAGGLLNLAAIVVIIVTISRSTENRGMHDEFAGTGVVRTT